MITLAELEDSSRRYRRPHYYVVDLKELLEHLTEGKSDPEIGRAFGVSSRAIASRIFRLCTETGAKNRTQLAVWYATGKIK